MKKSFSKLLMCLMLLVCVSVVFAGCFGGPDLEISSKNVSHVESGSGNGKGYTSTISATLKNNSEDVLEFVVYFELNFSLFSKQNKVITGTIQPSESKEIFHTFNFSNQKPSGFKVELREYNVVT